MSPPGLASTPHWSRLLLNFWQWSRGEGQARYVGLFILISPALIILVLSIGGHPAPPSQCQQNPFLPRAGVSQGSQKVPRVPLPSLRSPQTGVTAPTLHPTTTLVLLRKPLQQ